MNGDAELLTVGQLARRTGLSARTIRFWSDAGVVPPTRRSAGGYRLYDGEALARLELVSTLRELGLGLEPIERILRSQTTLSEAVEVHVRALDAEIRLLRSRRSILRGMAKHLDKGEMPQMYQLAKKSAEERQRVIDEFVTEVFDGADSPEVGIIAEWMREMPAELPDDPAPEQVQAWVELGELVNDQDFRASLRHMIQTNARESHLNRGLELRPLVLLHAGGALAEGVAPDTPQGRTVLNRIIPADQDTTELLPWLEQIADPRIERYWHLLSLVNGHIPDEPAVPAFQWLLAALHTHR